MPSSDVSECLSYLHIHERATPCPLNLGAYATNKQLISKYGLRALKCHRSYLFNNIMRIHRMHLQNIYWVVPVHLFPTISASSNSTAWLAYLAMPAACQIEIPQQLFDAFTWHLVYIFRFPRRWILLTWWSPDFSSTAIMRHFGGFSDMSQQLLNVLQWNLIHAQDEM